MGKKSRLKKERKSMEKSFNMGGFSDKLTENFQKEIRNSEMWDQMVAEFGEKRAEEILKECNADIKPI